MRAALLTLTGMVLFSCPVLAQYGLGNDPLLTLAAEGRVEEAFLALLRREGGEQQAMELARHRAAEFLAILDKAEGIPLPRRLLVEGDLRLTLGQKDRALSCYRGVVRHIATGTGSIWLPGWVPPEPVFIETPGALLGGLHDNGLLRRFLLLGAWDDAARELARVADLHRRRTLPFIARVDVRGQPGDRDRIVRPAPVSVEELWFAVDHAAFWKARGLTARALGLLREHLLSLDIDRHPDEVEIGPPVPAHTPVSLPRRPWSQHPLLGAVGMMARPESTYWDFLQVVWHEHVQAGLRDDLVQAIERRLAIFPPGRRLLARIHWLEGRRNQALALECQHLHTTCRDPDQALERLAQVYELYGQMDLAMALWRRRLDRPDPGRALDALLHLGGRGKHPCLELALRQFDLEAERLDDLWLLEQTATAFRKAGQVGRWTDWLHDRHPRAASPRARANLALLLGNPEAALLALEEAAWAGTLHHFSRDRPEWHLASAQRHHLALLRLHVRANPEDRAAWWMIVHKEGGLTRTRATRLLESELEQLAHASAALDENSFLAQVGLEGAGPPFALAYRLLRLYEELGQHDALARLARRLVQGQPPFDRLRALLNADTSTEGDERDTAIRCLLLWLAHTREADDRRALRALAATANPGFRNQVARRLGEATVDRDTGRRPAYRQVHVTTQAIPNGVTLLARRDDVRALTADGRWVGTSWGLVRYQATADGMEITQIPLGATVTSLCPTPHGLYAGTPAGVFAIAAGPRPVPVRLRFGTEKTETKPDGTIGLVWWGDRLWVHEGETIWRYDPVRQQAQPVSSSQSFRDPNSRLFLAAGRLWSSTAVYEPGRELFTPVGDLPDTAEMVGGSRLEVWVVDPYGPAHACLSILDPRTRRLRPLRIAGLPRREENGTPHRVEVRGEDGERVWLQLGIDLLEYTRRTGTVRRVVPFLDDIVQVTPGPIHWGRSPVAGWLVARGGRPAGRIPARWLTDLSRCRQVGDRLLAGIPATGRAGGLFEIDTTRTTWRKLGAAKAELAGKRVHRLVFDDEEHRLYVGTSGGLTILSLPGHEVVGQVTVDDGLPAEGVGDVVRRGRTLYLSGARDHLASYDLRTGAIRWYAAHEHPPGVALQPMPALPDADEDETRTTGKELPLLGGAQTIDMTHDGKRYLAGARGLVILDDPRTPPRAKIDQRQVPQVPGTDERQRQEAERLLVTVRQPADLVRFLHHDNPHVRLEAVRQLENVKDRRPFLDALRLALRDPFDLVRQDACSHLERLKAPEVVPLLRALLEDREPQVRGQAGVALLRRGQTPGTEHFAAMLAHLQNDGRSEDPLAPLVPHAGVVDILRLVSQGGQSEGEQRNRLAGHLGRALRWRPEAVVPLLAQGRPEQPDNEVGLTPFETSLFAQAGQAILPAVWPALTSTDPWVRLRAAQVCGVVGAPCSLPYLCRALAQTETTKAVPRRLCSFLRSLTAPRTGGTLMGLDDTWHTALATLDPARSRETIATSVDEAVRVLLAAAACVDGAR